MLEQLLEENPSIEVVIDLHRDAMPEDRRLVVEFPFNPLINIGFLPHEHQMNDMGQRVYGIHDLLYGIILVFRSRKCMT